MDLGLAPKLPHLMELWTKVPENLEIATVDQLHGLNEIACQSASQVRIILAIKSIFSNSAISDIPPVSRSFL